MSIAPDWGVPVHQADEFRELARDLGCNADEAAVEDMVRKVAQVQPKTPVGERK